MLRKVFSDSDVVRSLVFAGVTLGVAAVKALLEARQAAV